FGVDAPPGVADPQFHVVVLALQFHGDAAALGGEFHGVGQQVGDDLLQPHGIGPDDAHLGVDVGLDLQLLGPGGGAELFDDGPDHLGGGDAAEFEVQPAGDDAGGIEQVVDQQAQFLGAADDGGDGFGGGRRVLLLV